MTATYPVARLTGAGSASLPTSFVNYVLSDAGQRTLRELRLRTAALDEPLHGMP